MGKYAISKELFPYSLFKFSVNKRFIKISNKLFKEPKCIWKDKDLKVERKIIEGYQGAPLDVLIMEPANNKGTLPCLINYHGGGFVLEATKAHYQLAAIYAKEANCKVVFVKYRLAPKFPLPIPTEDCFCTLKWVVENAEELGIDKNNIGVGGDSAGGNLSAAMTFMAKDRNLDVKLKFQMLIYPFLDCSLSSESNKKYIDTPVWNSKLSKQVIPLITPIGEVENLHYHSPVDAPDLTNLPPAYIESAEFDSLHDDAITYAKLLNKAGNEVVLNETKGTIHGYDVALKSSIAKDSINKRIEFMKGNFNK